jgi:CHASE2 domain-containing sensor protein
MRKRLIQYFFRLEYLIGSLLVLVMVQLMLLISDSLPEADETSFLNPILDRIDFLNIADVSLDAIFAVRDAEFPDSRIKVINIGEVAPAPDGKIAALLYKLHGLGARVIGLDIILDDLHLERFPPERLMEVEDLRLALRDVPDVVLVNGFDPRTMKSHFDILPPIRDVVAHYGFANLVPDPDGVVRRFLPYAEVEGDRWISFPLKILELCEPAAITSLMEQDPDEQIIYYTSTYRQFETVPIDDVIFGTMYDGAFFKDAIVLVGFVNEGGLYYLDDTHKTPMGKKLGIEGADMPGILIHANVINMLLQGRFIRSVPPWVDWLLVFLLAYVSIALYRVLRPKPPGRLSLAILITVMLFAEAVIVFFFPLIAFFQFQVKISYNLMATAALLFIPANALTTWLRFWVRKRRVKREFCDSANPLPDVLCQAFHDDEPFLAHTRLMHAAFVLPQFAYAVCVREHAEHAALSRRLLQPGLEDWRTLIPEIDAAMATDTAGEADFRYFLQFLSGKKNEVLRESLVKEHYLSTELQTFNEFVYFDEWEILLPRIMRLWYRTLRPYLRIPLIHVGADGSKKVLRGAAEISLDEKGKNMELLPGLYRMRDTDVTEWTRLSPLCEWSECKLHRQSELFVFAGLMQKQHGIPPVPSYFGSTPNCEPILPVWTVDELYEIINVDYHRERNSR